MINQFDYLVLKQKLLKLTGGYWTIIDVLERELASLSSGEKEMIVQIMVDLQIIEIKQDWQESFTNAYQDGEITIPRTEEMKVFRIV